MLAMSTEPSAPTQDAPLPSAASFARPHRTLDVGHSRVASWTFGRGPDVVFVHGWPLSAATYRAVARELCADFTCHLLDLPGAGLTETTQRDRIDLRAHAETLGRAIDALGLDRHALVAHDSGGFVARLHASRDVRVAGLVLSNTEIPGHHPPMLLAYLALARTGRIGERLLRAVLASATLRRSRLGFGGCFEDPSFEGGEFHDLFLRPLLESRAHLEGALALLRNAGPDTMADLAAIHARIRVPVRLVWGTRDPWFPLERAREMRPGFGGPTDLVEIAGGKLFVHEDRAPEVAAAARDHLTRCFADA